jgi:O-antigen/teichoic acid export membrane protein
MKKNIIANLIGKLFGGFSHFIFIPLYIAYLGFESYSIISFTLVIAGLMALLDGGLTATLSREFARMDNSLADKIRIFKTVESSYFLLVSVCITILIVFSDLIAYNWLNLNNLNPNRVSLFIKIISFGVGSEMLLRFYVGGLLGLEKQVKANVFRISWGIVRNGMVVLVIIFVPRLEVFFLWQTLSTVIFTIILKFILSKSLTGFYIHSLTPKIEKVVLKNIWRFAGGMLLISIVASLNLQMDKLAISKLLAVESLGHYTLAVSLSMVIFLIVSPISVAVLPRFTGLYSKGKSIDAALLFSKINLYVGISTFALMANMLFFAEELIWIWTGNTELAAQASIYLPIISISYTMLSLQIFPFNIAVANGYTKLNNQLGVISLFVTLPGYWLATKYYGGIGAASVFCAVQTSTTLIYIYFIKKKFLKEIQLKTLYIKQLLFPLLISIVIAYGFSLISMNILVGRIETLLWIGFSTIITVLISSLILTPLKQLKQLVNFKILKKK